MQAGRRVGRFFEGIVRPLSWTARCCLLFFFVLIKSYALFLPSLLSCFTPLSNMIAISVSISNSLSCLNFLLLWLASRKILFLSNQFIELWFNFSQPPSLLAAVSLGESGSVLLSSHFEPVYNRNKIKISQKYLLAPTTCSLCRKIGNQSDNHLLTIIIIISSLPLPSFDE